MNTMRNLLTAALMTVVITVLLGIVYPLGITAIAQAVFPDKANGQLITQNNSVVGSRIIGQGSRSRDTSGPDRRQRRPPTTPRIPGGRSSDRPTRS